MRQVAVSFLAWLRIFELWDMYSHSYYGIPNSMGARQDFFLVPSQNFHLVV